MKRLFKKILAESTPENRAKGQISTLFASVLIVVSNSGILYDRPILKTVVDYISGALMLKAGGYAVKTKNY